MNNKKRRQLAADAVAFPISVSPDGYRLCFGPALSRWDVPPTPLVFRIAPGATEDSLIELRPQVPSGSVSRSLLFSWLNIESSGLPHLRLTQGARRHRTGWRMNRVCDVPL